ncbi:MAG: energy-coupling factor transporter ATPase [Negativicoccus succinicivorans]|uniref:energy-coupling factor transporter ATPase n=1 Tax=Negativicoccus succinicivorans TaxID=620903 RepID=UPI0026EA8521|nr:energy-coupling factor transporter ATPase [Negativicoccus succinicivorans]MBS6028473.1 energy-coupling factor transporter ATPase [Negativicoccus succinicivorans]
MSIQIKAVNYTYGAGTPYEKQALRNINLEIKEGEFVGIIGHTGSGKSTLVQHLNGLLSPTSGTVTVDGVNLAGKDAAARKARHSVGMVFQYPEHQLFEETIRADIAFGPTNLGLDAAKIDERVRVAMHFVGLPYDEFAERSPFHLSGGQQRRVAIAGVIAMHPRYLVLDEPSAGLDPIGRQAIFDRVKEWHEDRRFTVILVSHNMEDISRLASRVIVLNKGEIMLDGNPLDIFINRRAELAAAGVEAPPVSRLLARINECGCAVDERAIEPEEATANILAALGQTPRPKAARGARQGRQ